MSAGVYDIYIEQGATFSKDITYCSDDAGLVPMNLTGWLGRGHIRLFPPATAILAQFIVTITNAALGQINIRLLATASDPIRLSGRTWEDVLVATYDIEIYNGAEVIRVLNGAASISPSSTR